MGAAAEFYLHNASTFSPGGTCGAIPSRPLRRRSWCALLRLRAGRAPDTVDAGRSRKGGDLALLRRTSGGRGGPGGRASRRAGSTRPNFFPAGRSLDVSRIGLRRRGRHLGAGTAAGPRAPRPSFSAPAWPPGVPFCRPPPPRFGSTGLCPGAEPKPRPPALRPLGTGPPKALSRQTRRCTRTHTYTLTHSQSPREAPTPARPLWVSGRPARSSPSSSSSGEGGSLLRGARAAGRKGEAARVPWALGAGLVPSHGGSRRLGVAGQGAGLAGGWVRARRRRGRKKAERRGAPRLDWGGPSPPSGPLALLPRRLPHPGACGRFRAARPPAQIPPSLGLPAPSSSLPSSPSHVRPAPVSA